jgi:hypothetical protein
MTGKDWEAFAAATSSQFMIAVVPGAGVCHPKSELMTRPVLRPAGWSSSGPPRSDDQEQERPSHTELLGESVTTLRAHPATARGSAPTQPDGPRAPRPTPVHHRRPLRRVNQGPQANPAPEGSD